MKIAILNDYQNVCIKNGRLVRPFRAEITVFRSTDKGERVKE